MKSIKTIFMCALVAGLLLATAGSALAAYSGNYVNTMDSTRFVNLGDSTFSIDGGDNYAVTAQDYTVPGIFSPSFTYSTWVGKGTNDTFYGVRFQNEFAFINTTEAVGPYSHNHLVNLMYSFVTGNISIDGLVNYLGWNASIDALVGYGTFAEDGNSFTVNSGWLSDCNLWQNLHCANYSETYAKATPIPGAIWLLGTGLIGLLGLKRRISI